jgi:lysozyme
MKAARRTGLALVLLAAAAFALWGYAPHWHPSDRRYPVQGIDVSHHQGRIDWRALPAQGVDFAYIKASEGGDHRDPAFAANWAGARSAGIARGAYHFYTLCRPGAEQAANFIAAVPVEPDALPPAVDLEYLGNCGRKPSRAELHRELAAYIRPVEARFGKPVLLYLTREFDETYEVSARANRPLWLRSLVIEPRFGARAWDIWQASNFRRLRGIEGRVDWNVRRP